MKIQFPDEFLARQWEEIDWPQAEETLAAMQKSLAYAACAHDTKRVVEFQKQIVRCTEAKLLAVRHVCESSSGPGMDGVRWTRPEQKMKAALALTSDGYEAKPLREIIVHSKSTGRDRRIGIPTYYDRAMQVLYSYSLAPVAEAGADRKSFAFRRGRSMLDVSAYIMEALKGKDAPEFVVVADVKACYASIQHSWPMEHTPMDKKVLREFLKCGHVFAGELFPADEVGISLGANLSPLLGNLTLDGLQKYLYDHLYPDQDNIDYLDGNMIRFADDILVTVRTKKGGEKVLTLLANFLNERGLRLSREKCRIANIRDGVTFLSRTYIKKNGIVHTSPSEKAVERVKGELSELILTHKKSQRSLIMAVNSKIRKWASYHRYSEAFNAFREIDTAVQTFLLQAAINKHPRMQQAKIISKYWYREAGGRYIYALPDQKEIHIISLVDVMLVEHRKVAVNKNHFIDTEYFEMRERQKGIERVTADFRPIWQRQNGCCYYCGRPILQDQRRTLVQLDMSISASKRNMAYVHTICKPNELCRMDMEDDVTVFSDYEILQMLDGISAAALSGRQKQSISQDWKHIKLKTFFANSKAASITLTFAQIEKIDGQKLPPTAEKCNSYWYPRTTCNTIAEAWITEQYELVKLDRDKKVLRFKRCKEGLVHIQLPKWLTEEKIPDDARFEIENYLDYIKSKYGL